MIRQHLKASALSAGAVAGAAALVASLVIGTTAAGASVSRPSRPSGALPVLTLAMNGKTITVGGTLQSGGVEIVSTVTHEASGEPVLVRLDDGATIPQFLAVLPKAAEDPNNLYGIAQIVIDAQANRGTSSVQSDLLPGTYFALDLSPSTPVLSSPFTIAAAATPASLPRPGATITSIEFAFRGADRIRDGELVRFANQGFLVHMAFGARARNLKQAKEIAKLLHEGKDNQAQRLAVGQYDFDGGLSHGQFQQFVVNVHPGYWVVACFMETQDGREHTLFGMERVIQILK
jgi:hypothetical protein